MTRLALFGAGGKMGMRLGRNLKSSAYEVAAVELSSEGQRRIESELGWKGVDADTAIKGAEIVVLAVPDTAIGKVAHADHRQAQARDDDRGARCRRTLCRPSAQSATTSPISSPIPAIRRSSTTRPTWPRSSTASAASRPSRPLSARSCRGRSPTTPRARRWPARSGPRSCARIASPSNRWPCSSRAFPRPSSPRCST